MNERIDCCSSEHNGRCMSGGEEGPGEEGRGEEGRGEERRGEERGREGAAGVYRKIERKRER